MRRPGGRCVGYRCTGFNGKAGSIRRDRRSASHRGDRCRRTRTRHQDAVSRPCGCVCAPVCTRACAPTPCARAQRMPVQAPTRPVGGRSRARAGPPTCPPLRGRIRAPRAPVRNACACVRACAGTRVRGKRACASRRSPLAIAQQILTFPYASVQPRARTRKKFAGSATASCLACTTMEVAQVMFPNVADVVPLTRPTRL